MGSSTGDEESAPGSDTASDDVGDHDERRSASAKRPYASALPPDDAGGDVSCCASGWRPDASDDADDGCGVKANGIDGEPDMRATGMRALTPCTCSCAPATPAWRAAEGETLARGVVLPAKGGRPVIGEPPMCCSAQSR